MSKVIRVVSVAAVLLLAPAWAGGLPATEKCQVAKLNEARKYAACRLKAEARAVKSGGAPDYAKCDEKFGQKWTAAETKADGACPATGDVTAMQAFITRCTDDVTDAVAGAPLPECSSETCGNGVIDAGEDCDLGTLNGATCASEGFAGGVLACADGCVFDTGGCFAVRFVDTGAGAIRDNQTGLTWEKKSERNGVNNFANPHDADNIYRWAGQCTLSGTYCQPTAAAAALCAANVEGGTIGCDECIGGDGICDQGTTVWTWAVALNDASFAGHTDWRVPTLHELLGIIDYADATPPLVNVAFHGASCGAACTDLGDPACACTQANHYWSASTYPPIPSGVWLPTFDDGRVDATSRTEDTYVRAVRGGS